MLTEKEFVKELKKRCPYNKGKAIDYDAFANVRDCAGMTTAEGGTMVYKLLGQGYFKKTGNMSKQYSGLFTLLKWN